MRIIAIALLLCATACSQYADLATPHTCANPRELSASIVKLSGGNISASAIMVAPMSMLTAEHVAKGFRLDDEWQRVTISQQIGAGTWEGDRLLIRRRMVFTTDTREALQLIELARPLFWRPLYATLRETPLMPDEYVLGIGYAQGERTYASGRYVTAGLPVETTSGFLGFRFARTPHMITLQDGASGGGIFDCRGQVVGVIERGYKGPLTFLQKMMFNQANVFASSTLGIREQLH